ncbi:MAG: hypothetical protein M0R21_11540 [Lentimicrobiaceae bacterium]|nr:hypothetical protein [Lentimicrobiaceae bacterium]
MKEHILKKMFSLDGRVVVLTDAGGTLAGEIASTVAHLGASAVILDFSQESANTTA